MLKQKATILTHHHEWTLANGKRVNLTKLSQQELIAFGQKYPKLVRVEDVKPSKPVKEQVDEAVEHNTEQTTD